jgi:hypothetical protein
MRVFKCFVMASVAFAGSVAAQGQPPQTDPKNVAPVTSTPGVDGTTPAPRLPGSGRNQFSSPVMGIDIKGEGLSLPSGVAQPEEPLIPPAPPAKPSPAPQPATAK